MARFIVQVSQLLRRPKEAEAASEEGERFIEPRRSSDWAIVIQGHHTEPLNSQAAERLQEEINAILGPRSKKFSVEPAGHLIHRYHTPEELKRRVAAFQPTQAPHADQRTIEERGTDWEIRQLTERTEKEEREKDSHVPTEEEHLLIQTVVRDLRKARDHARLVAEYLQGRGHSIQTRGIDREGE